MLPNIDDFWDFSDPAATEAKFRAILPDCVGPQDANYRKELLTQMARTLGLQRKFDEAHAVLDGVAHDLGSEENRLRVRYLLERGRVFNSSGRKDEARPLFVGAWDLGKKLGEEGFAVDAAHMVAITESSDGALKWNLLALELAEKSEQPAARKWRKSLHNNLGWTYFSSADYEKALHHFEMSRQAAEEMGEMGAERIARWSIAKTYRAKGDLQTALDLQYLQLKEAPDGPFVHEELAECLYALGKIEEAKLHFAKAHELLSKDIWLQANEAERIERLGRLAGRI